MTRSPDEKYVCIHGHFYQPPRENPWLDAMEREASASPYHNWNERINFECYRANTAARLVDENNRILRLHNNYRSLSFNFGPTLLRWLERHDPWVYRSIIEADQESHKRLKGHGNAIAQAYNHLIMPLANRRDKITQIVWGLRDFEWRFGRKSEGMWLPETAVDLETLGLLADSGIKYTILSPFQASRWRFLDREATWQDARGGGIPTGRPYRCTCPNGKTVVIFFYDASFAKGIAFERYLQHSGILLSKIGASHASRDAAKNEPWLVHSATDGESYGHHFKFGDMALAAAFEQLEQEPGAQVLNYGLFLASFPTRAQVEILENTAWSCAHGVGRWMSDCGCHIGGGPGWNQRWREPLREALNQLRESLALHYEREMGLLAEDPWQVRNEYIEVILDRQHQGEGFVDRHMGSKANAKTIVQFYKLLEMQQHAMAMFTSCGWFFDDISGLESTLILRFAARAIQLAEETGAPALEPPFLKTLGKAPSNLPEYGNGASVYAKKVKPEIVGMERVAANYALQSLARSSRRQYHIYSFDVSPLQEEYLGPNPAPCLIGHVDVRDNRTREEAGFLYAVLHFEGLDFRCSIKPYASMEENESILKALQEAVEEQNTVKMIRILDEVFGSAFFTLHDAFRDLRSSLALEISENTMMTYTHFQRHFYQTSRPLMGSLRQWGIRIPSDLRVAVRRVLSDDVSQLVAEILKREDETSRQEKPWDETDFFYRAHTGRLLSILEEARFWGVALQLNDLGTRLGQALVHTLTGLMETFAPWNAGKLIRLVNICRILGVRPETWKLQTLYFQLAQTGLKNPNWVARIQNFGEFLISLDQFLECRFSPSFAEIVPSLPREIMPVPEPH